jgi:hypothetical protein
MSKRLAPERMGILLCVLAATVCAVMGSAQLLQPPTSFTGRWGWLSEFMFTAFGVAGPAAIWFVLAFVPLVLARMLWRHANRIPSDRWYRS